MQIVFEQSCRASIAPEQSCRAIAPKQPRSSNREIVPSAKSYHAKSCRARNCAASQITPRAKSRREQNRARKIARSLWPDAMEGCRVWHAQDTSVMLTMLEYAVHVCSRCACHVCVNVTTNALDTRHHCTRSTAEPCGESPRAMGGGRTAWHGHGQRAQLAPRRGSRCV